MYRGSDTPPLRIAQMIESLAMGGAERLVVQIAEALHERGVDSHIYVIGSEAPLASTIGPGVKLRRLNHERASVKDPIAFISSLRRGRSLLVRSLRDDGIDVVQSHLPGANFWALLLQRAGHLRAIPTIHNNREFDYGDADHPVRARFRRMAYRRMMKDCPAVVAVSDLVRQSMADQLGLTPAEQQTMVVVHNGVSVPVPLMEERRAEIRRRFGADPDTVFMLAAGRHVEQKNFRCLVQAARRLRDDSLDFKLVIAGEGPLSEDLRRFIVASSLQEHVELPGVVEDLRDVMQAADLFVLPSLWEGLPLVLLEAMAAARPVVATRIEGVAEVLTHGENGLLAAPGDEEDLARCLEEAIRSPEDRVRMGKAAYAHVADHYAFTSVAEKLHALYARVVKENP